MKVTGELKTQWNMKVMVILIVIDRISTVTGRLRNKGTHGDQPNYRIKIGQNTKKSPGDLRRLAVTQTPMKNHQLLLV